MKLGTRSGRYWTQRLKPKSTSRRRKLTSRYAFRTGSHPCQVGPESSGPVSTLIMPARNHIPKHIPAGFMHVTATSQHVKKTRKSALQVKASECRYMYDDDGQWMMIDGRGEAGRRLRWGVLKWGGGGVGGSTKEGTQVMGSPCETRFA